MPNYRSIHFVRYVLLCFAMVLSACGKPDSIALGPLPEDAHALIRGTDINQNGIRDEIEGASASMATSLTERLRMLSYSWALQQGLEVAMLGDDAAVKKVATYIADTTACVMITDVNTQIAQNLIDLYGLTVDSPIRRDASSRLEARSAPLGIVPSQSPCATADALAASVLKASKESLSQTTTVSVMPTASSPSAESSKP